ncbi:MAG: hypothetical protein KJZ77_15765 [Anaerolineales bacterium]|nr:hypothetical protein [Anaerolineales bacterium]
MLPLELEVKSSYTLRVLFIGLFTLGLGALAMLLEQRMWARTFTHEGVTRRDGKQFRWADLLEKNAVYIRQRGAGQGSLNNYELVFKDGKALVFHRMLENEGEVMRFLETVSAQGKQA